MLPGAASDSRLGDNPLYTTLDSSKIIGTAEQLARRVGERFPGSGLSRVSNELVTVARNSERDARLLGTAVRPIRILVAVVLRGRHRVRHHRRSDAAARAPGG